MQPEYYREWDAGRQNFTFVPFLRLDETDPQRTHFDLRELTWTMVRDNWELRAGVRKLFWGVTESQHLVDIINQTDLVESTDGEEKLGQPMLNLSYFSEYGTFDFFLLPYFRERTFAGRDSRLRSAFYVDTNQATYESSAGENHLDWAVRWLKTVGDWDIGLSHFSGTSRAPTLRQGTDAHSNSVMIPHYPLLEQTGLDIQSTKDAWLWKLEAVSSRSQGERHTAATGGFEYTFVGIMESDADLGLIGEYLWDDRGEAAPTPFESDVMVGMRLTLNDAASSELLLGSIVDVSQQNYSVSLEASRRVMENWKLSLESRMMFDAPEADPLYSMRRDSYLQIELARYF